MTSLSAAELNYIIYRYLQESGFTHSAFNFRFEAGINNLPIDGDSVPPAALVKLVQTGLQFKEMEANAENDADDEDFCFLPPMDLITKDVSELQKIVKGKMGIPSATGPKDLDKKGNEGTSSRVKDKARKVPEKQQQGVRIEESKDRVVRRRSERLRRKY
ncbi:F-box-like/WD repeat-containing protein tbl1xr1 [Phtheirospermum japonicum]|uniref:F-box-like/WD repeat-containing protein tbl1xr1 n=1 Tax=Phtheirospermum japonicum TaxID=374723 RepID=A0A830D5T4_9LAMI|nr:F-box-like/WD repeat-containing protein tbl1xr1 [Phtheirospermum japonicum]